MRVSEVDFLMLPERSGTSTTSLPAADHWISRWQRNLATAEWVVGANSHIASALASAAGKCKRPVVLVTHGNAVDVLIEAAPRLGLTPVIGAFVVAPSPSTDTLAALEKDRQTGPALDFASMMIASDNHPQFASVAAEKLAHQLGAKFVAAGPIGRIDASSGHGPWPDGLMRLGRFLKQLSAH